MASWSVLLALSGFGYSAPEQLLTLSPRLNKDHFQCFFSAGTGWGIYSQRAEKSSLTTTLEPLFGEIRVRSLRLRKEVGWADVSVAAATGPDRKHLGNCKVKVEEQAWLVDLGDELIVPSGKTVEVRLVAPAAKA